MKRKKITLQIIQDGILLLKDKELQLKKTNSVDNYKIINKEIFINDISKLFKKLKINQSIITDNIDIIIDNTYTEIEKEIIEYIFKELSFNKITFLEITDIFKLQKNEVLIDISKNNIKIYYLNEVLEQKIYFDQHIQYLKLLLRKILLLHNIKNIKLFGNSCNNKEIINTIEKISNSQVYIYSQPNQVPLQLLT